MGRSHGSEQFGQQGTEIDGLCLAYPGSGRRPPSLTSLPVGGSSTRRIRAMKKPAVWSRWGSVSRLAGSSGDVDRAARRRGPRGRSRECDPGTVRSVARSRRRDGACRVDKHAARTESARAGDEDRRLRSRDDCRRPARATRQRRSARACSVPSPEQGGSTSTRSKAAPSGRWQRGVGELDADHAARQPPCVIRPALSRAVALDGSTSPWPPISAARCVLLPPGAAHRSSTRSPGCGVERRARRASRRAIGR